MRASDGGPGHADAPARPPGQGGADGEDAPSRPPATGPMMAPARSSPPTSSASRIGWNVSKTIIATDQNTSTVTMPRSTAVVAQQAEAVADDGGRLLGRGQRRGAAPRRRGARRRARLAQQDEDGDEVHDVEGRRRRRRAAASADGAGERVPPDEATRDQRTDRDADTEHGALRGERAVDVGAGRRSRGPCRRTTPRAARSRAPGRRRSARRPARKAQKDVRDEQDAARDDVDDGGDDEDRPAPEGVGEAARRQLEEEDRQPGGRRDGHRLRDGEAALELPQGEQADDEPDREPAGEGEREEDPAGGGGGEDGIRCSAGSSGRLRRRRRAVEVERVGEGVDRDPPGLRVALADPAVALDERPTSPRASPRADSAVTRTDVVARAAGVLPVGGPRRRDVEPLVVLLAEVAGVVAGQPVEGGLGVLVALEVARVPRVVLRRRPATAAACPRPPRCRWTSPTDSSLRRW